MGLSNYILLSSPSQAAPYKSQSNNTATTIGSTTSDKTIEIRLLADSLENRLKSAAILELTSKLPEVKSVPYSNLISPNLHGTPKMLIYQKETINRDISYLRNQAKANIKKYVDERLPEEL
jgi:hypothetical protein